jgi:hypothetical protein
MDEFAAPFDPFDHDGFVVSRKRGLDSTSATALHPDGEFICRAVRTQRTLARLVFGLVAAAVVSVTLLLVLGGFLSAFGTTSSGFTLAVVMPLLVALVLVPVSLLLIRKAPDTPTRIWLMPNSDPRLDEWDVVVRRSPRVRLSGEGMVVEDGAGTVLAHVGRHGLDNSRYTLRMEGETVQTRFVPRRKVGWGAAFGTLASLTGPFLALLLTNKPVDSWDIVRPKSGMRVGALVKEKSEHGTHVLDLTDDPDRLVDRRVITAVVLAVICSRPK